MFRVLMVGATGYDPADCTGTLTELGARVEAALGRADTVNHLTESMYDIILLDLMTLGEEETICMVESIRLAEAEMGGHTPIAVIGTTPDHAADRLRQAGVENIFASPPLFEDITEILQSGEGYGLIKQVDSNEPSEIKILDMTEFNNEFSTTQVAKLLPIFLRVGGEQISTMETAMATDNIGTMTRVAHSLKGSAAQIGAGQLRFALAELEAMGRRGDLAGCRGQSAQLRQLFDNTAGAVKTYLADLG